MRKAILILMTATALLGAVSCSKDDPAPVALASAPEADAAEDNKSGGIYKGALIGSSGIIKITLQKGVKEIEITLDGATKKLATASLESWTSGEEIVDAVFSKDDWTVTFSIDATGETGGVAFNIPGHPDILPVITKETSTAQVKAYEGTYAGSDVGTWNFIEKSGIIFGISRSTAEPSNSSEFYGTKTGNNLEITIPGSSSSAAGAIDGNGCSGTWQTTVDFKGTWTGKRTL